MASDNDERNATDEASSGSVDLDRIHSFIHQSSVKVAYSNPHIQLASFSNQLLTLFNNERSFSPPASTSSEVPHENRDHFRNSGSIVERIAYHLLKVRESTGLHRERSNVGIGSSCLLSVQLAS